MISIETKIIIIVLLTVGTTAFICYQTWRLGKFMHDVTGTRPSFQWVEVAGWLVLLLLRLRGMWRISDEIERAKTAGLISDTLTWDQLINLIWAYLFLVLIAVSKHLERRAIKRAWGI